MLLEKGQIIIRTSDITTKEMQKRVDQYISQFKEGYFSPLALMARLTEEVGELAREMNHYYGEKPKKSTEKENTVEDELGDILFVIACMANSLDIDLSDAFNRSMTKFETRDKDRWTKKELQQEGRE
ncbi:nucleotide pyrophosphohydrolase [Ornithinibacillus sp. BX22]|uniref:Nucleotide pyrophosphohydrolase n=2 Tax=Ornithinibacillus TaxID=484508 RepID=A0A923RIB4_9BACI|nr:MULTISPECIES: nucleotide pyrophosphohydrolase [Ornithinibacillus]MBC5637056.1 nucleotide pyrophosphohydrolase [Ornithinibacillus hominis]MBS3679733.1 nucleotide pyrophosphohydrolase [Ornithinibacillus massiliensis]